MLIMNIWFIIGFEIWIKWKWIKKIKDFLLYLWISWSQEIYYTNYESLKYIYIHMNNFNITSICEVEILLNKPLENLLKKDYCVVNKICLKFKTNIK